jgi:alpha-D-ribose 1-methylphosphonate 5-triphosphate synthase subunit PhnH
MLVQDLAGGFADPVLDAQSVFRTLLDAMANPAMIHPLEPLASPPAPLSREAAAVALALCDVDTPLWLDETLARQAGVRSWLEFHTGAPMAGGTEGASFAIIPAGRPVPALDLFAQGSQEYPDRSTTIILEVAELGAGESFRFEGPGIRGHVALAATGLPGNFAAQWKANRARFPRGVDLVLVAPGKLACLPRTARLAETEA